MLQYFDEDTVLEVAEQRIVVVERLPECRSYTSMELEKRNNLVQSAGKMVEEPQSCTLASSEVEKNLAEAILDDLRGKHLWYMLMNLSGGSSVCMWP